MVELNERLTSGDVGLASLSFEGREIVKRMYIYFIFDYVEF